MKSIQITASTRHFSDLLPVTDRGNFLPLFAYKLVNLWDMEKFIADAFYMITPHIVDLRRIVGKIERGKLMPAQERHKFGSIVDNVLLVQCAAIGLQASVSQIERLSRALKHNNMTAGRLMSDLETVNQVIISDLRSKLFLYVPDDKAKYFNQTEPLFGEAVLTAFPSAATDVSEAGKCLAADRGTACVFHLMRVMEVGLKVLAKRLRIPYAPNWGQFLRRIDDQMKLKQTQKPQWFKRNEAFFTEAAIHIGAVKNTWRNPTMHMEKTHTVEQAGEIFNSVRSFMRHLATKLKE